MHNNNERDKEYRALKLLPRSVVMPDFTEPHMHTVLLHMHAACCEERQDALVVRMLK
jgi:hypothetical protein